MRLLRRSTRFGLMRATISNWRALEEPGQTGLARAAMAWGSVSVSHFEPRVGDVQTPDRQRQLVGVRRRREAPVSGLEEVNDVVVLGTRIAEPQNVPCSFAAHID